jgi:BirA family transcriptional regulator, biotin operon repressor / biotin---[acetyl-CoA-carboxylase] ligase
LRPTVAGLSTEPCGMVDLRPGISAAEALALIALPLVETLRTFEQQGFAAFQAAFNARDALAQVAISVSDGTQGVAQGVDSVGALQVQTAQGWVRVTSSEVSVRPQPGLTARPL